MPSALPLYCPLPFLNIWLLWCWNSGSTVVSDQPTIYTWHRFSFLVGPSAFPSMLGSPCQDTVARRALVLQQGLLAGAEGCSRPYLPQQVCGTFLCFLWSCLCCWFSELLIDFMTKCWAIFICRVTKRGP